MADFAATIEPSIEAHTDRPCEVGRITYTEGAHRYVALAFRHTDKASPWRLTWIGHDGTSDAVPIPEGVYPSEAMSAALARAAGEGDT